MISQKRQKGEIIHIIDDRPEKRYVIVGVLLSLTLHLAGIGKPVYEAWKHVRSWHVMLSLEIVDAPGANIVRAQIEWVDLTEPLYYPPGLVKPIRDPSRQEEVHKKPQRPRPVTEHRKEESLESSEQIMGSDLGASTQQPDLQAQVQQLHQEVQRARTLNIGPIRELVANLYKAQQEGLIAIGEIGVAVNFRVRQDGAFTHVRLVESSGIPEVDNAALLIVDELSQLQAMAPLQETDSVTLRLSIAQEVILRTTVASSSEVEAAEQVSQLNGLLAAARLLSLAQKQTRATELLSKIEIKQEGVNIIAIARIARAEASQLLKKQFKTGG